MAERISLFGIVTGIAMLLAGIGLAILALFVFGALGGEARRRAASPSHRRPPRSPIADLTQRTMLADSERPQPGGRSFATCEAAPPLSAACAY